MADFELPGYELYERLGRGGMATVYRALHLNLDREVAIKVMDPAMSSDEHFSERFIREARISARLTHPHILQIYDVNSFDGLNYIAMELLSGGELADFIHDAMPQKQIYQILEQMTEALDYAAGRGYVHRDIKPSNIMRRDDGEYVLADFGIARAANSGTQMTQTGLMVGTPSYMSPEQAKGQEVDGRSDLYALAVLAYEMLTKTLPYESDSAVTTAVKHLTEDIPTLPENLSAYQEFLNKGLAKSADDRFQTGRELYASFQEASSAFSDDDVLTEAVEPPPAAVSGVSDAPGVSGMSGDADQRTSFAGMESTRLSHSSSPAVSSSSRPYRLDGNMQRERLVGGTHAEKKRAEKSGNPVVRLLLIAVVAGGLGYGGYVYWQNQQGSASKDRANVTAELAAAYSAMNNDDLNAAASSFYKARELDSSSAAAQQGMDEVERLFKASIEAAIAEKDTDRARSLLLDFSGYFASNTNLERYQAELDLLDEQKNLAAVQAERIEKLMMQAQESAQAGDHAEARLLLDRAIAIDSVHPAVIAAQASLQESEAKSEAYEQYWTEYSDEQRQAFNEATAAADEALAGGQIEVARAALQEAFLIAEDAPELARRAASLAAVEEQLVADAAQEQARIDGLLDQADEAVAAIATDPANAGAALELYAQVESADPENSRAAAGVASVVGYYLAIAEDAADEGDFDGARASLLTAQELVPGDSDVTSMQASLDDQEQAWQQRQAQASAAQEQVLAEKNQAEELAARGSRALGSGALDVAQQAYDEVVQTHPDLPVVQALDQGLRQAYATAAREQIDLKEFDAAEALVAQGAANFPGDGSWQQLEEEIETARSSSRRRLGAY